jgi:hypothetical protein
MNFCSGQQSERVQFVLYYAFACSLALGNSPPNGKKNMILQYKEKGNEGGEEDKSKKASLDALLFTVHIGDRVVLSDAMQINPLMAGNRWLAGSRSSLWCLTDRHYAFCPTHQSPQGGH